MKVTERGYTCLKPWPEDCFVQSGDSGVVFRSVSKGGNYTTAFFEAFPKSPDCFIRGEGSTVEEAEKNAFDTLVRYQSCDHDFERLNAQGRGKCRLCRLQTDDALPSENRCVKCDVTGALFESPFGSYLNPGADPYCCFPCLVNVVAPRYLETDLSDIVPSQLAEDRDEAHAWFAETFEDMLQAKLAIDLAQEPLFIGLDDKTKASELSRKARMVYRNTMRQKMSLIENMLELNAPGVRYLDEAGMLEAVCTPAVIDSGAFLAKLVWLRQENHFEDQDEADVEKLIQGAFKQLIADLVTATFHYGQLCEEQPPAFADQRKRVPTEAEFKSALSGLAQALAGSPKTPETPGDSD